MSTSNNIEYLERMCDSYANAWLDKGAYEIHLKECAIGYIQSFAIRSLCAGFKITGNNDYRMAAKIWADFTLKLQGTQGHPDAYNMGYHNEVRRDGIPMAWYPADCGDMALAVLDTASILENNDPMKANLIDSVVRFTDYVLNYWSNEDDSVGGFIEDYKEDHYNFWCADSRICNVLWGLEDILRDRKYHDRAVQLTHHSATIDLDRKDKEGKECGYGYSLAVYMPDAICNGLGHIGGRYPEIREECIEHLNHRFLSWTMENQQPNGAWNLNSSKLEEESLGGYHGSILVNLILAKPYIKDLTCLNNTIDKALCAAKEATSSIEKAEGKHKWGMNSKLGLAFAASIDPSVVFPKKSN